MIDLINRVDEWVKADVNAVQQIVNKFAPVLEGTLPEKNIPYLAVIFNICVDYLQGSHGATSAEWKAWSVLLIKKLFEEDKLKKEADIHLIIDEFIEYKEKEYKSYCDDIISVSDYDRDIGFMYRFFWKKTKKKSVVITATDLC